MKKIFLDTNILLDFLENNRVNRVYAEVIVELAKTGSISLFASYLSFANMAYILRKKPQNELLRLLTMAKNVCSVLPCDSAQLEEGLKTPSKDFEDMLQYQCAKAAVCDVIVTNNKQDFDGLNALPVFTAEEFLLDFIPEKGNNAEAN
ncbi:MAG: PIN domain-containing protein [Bacteroidales bacterium]|nr:PIN domain-containing protein [Bacteroidales bacterium]MBR4678328.1 PIN domain-containing protein [Bacteroidales bacterium]